RWALGRGALHRGRLPARVLSPLSRLSRVLPALGAGALSQPQARKRCHHALRDVMATGAVTGLAAEARIARRAGLVAAAGAGTPEGTDRAIRSLIEQGVPGIVSFGIAGGLAPNLASGTLIAPAAVRGADDEAHWVDVEWHARLTRAAHAAGVPL